MPNKDRNIPKRRFKEFENADAWELRKLGEVGTVAMCRRIFKEQTSEHGEIPFYKIGTFGGTPDAFIARELFEEFKDKYSYPNIGDILISASGSIGRTVEFLGEDEYFQDSNIVWLKHDGKINNIFLKQFYSIVKWSGIEGSTIKRLYNENILNTEISLPTLPEQKAIGSFFSTLDRQITLHQRKLDKLKCVKQAYLSEMFPAEGERVPKRRFPGFTDAWELRKLGEVMEVTSVKRIHQSDWTDFGVRFLRARDIVAESKNESVSEPLFISQKKYDEYTAISGKVTKGDLLVTGVGTIGIPMLIEKNEPIYFKDGNIIWFKNENHIDGQFFYYSFIGKKIQSFIKESAGIGTVGTFTINTGKNTPIDLPVLKKEQEAIGTFFSTLDRHITLHQRKLEKLKNLKKALLNELFV
ncbi:restriction endonuclease subunit S [Streptococcus suis]|uniref:Restriction endonuclease subunit S n=3 Tax=Streptococcus suis TaxID=1307 RepID=A0A2I5KMJ0_STRSU|nr:restriction endonuclease subunit S [Streptococcus suis]AUA18584.1 restriction endonuclease subunit S [Streptococcus suis]